MVGSAKAAYAEAKKWTAARELEAQAVDTVEAPMAFGHGGEGGHGGGHGFTGTHQHFTGDKFLGGFGDTKLFTTDYWTLRKRSVQLFKENLYGRGLIRRLVTNEINTGLSLESVPEEGILGLEAGSLDDWTEMVENRFHVWTKDPESCDFKKSRTFGKLQREMRREALISGDVLVILRQDPVTRLPAVDLISGAAVRTPHNSISMANGHKIKHGVELNAAGIQVAYWVMQEDLKSIRIPARGARSGRRTAWLQYGTDKLLDDVRGEPLLSLVLQSLKEIDRYRDSVQRKAVISSLIAVFIKKNSDKISSLPMTGGATRKDVVQTSAADGTPATRKLNGHHPGMVFEELQEGEEPVAMNSQGTDTDFGVFEEAIIQAVAWANEIPPEILKLAFSNNYSASQAAINEFKIYLNKIRTEIGETFCQPIYTEWVISQTLLRKIEADGFLDAWRDPLQRDIFGAWIASDWSGAIKPSTDIFKQARGYSMLNDRGWISNDRASRELTGTKFSKNMKKIKRENEMRAEAARPLAEFKAEFGDVGDEALQATSPQEIFAHEENDEQ